MRTSCALGLVRGIKGVLLQKQLDFYLGTWVPDAHRSGWCPLAQPHHPCRPARRAERWVRGTEHGHTLVTGHRGTAGLPSFAASVPPSYLADTARRAGEFRRPYTGAHETDSVRRGATVSGTDFHSPSGSMAGFRGSAKSHLEWTGSRASVVFNSPVAEEGAHNKGATMT